jgi:hypothetical protein
MSSSYLKLLPLFSIGFQIIQGVLFLWIALLVFRSRTTAAWITLIAAILSPLFLQLGRLRHHPAMQTPSGGTYWSDEVFHALSLGYVVASLAFAVGLLLHLQRRKLESDRIADLEAILHDLQQNSDPR